MVAIADIVVELKTKGLIGEDVEVVVKDLGASKMLPISTNSSKKRITCSRDIQILNEKELRVCLLHECAHILLFPRFRVWFLLSATIWSAGFLTLVGRLLVGNLLLALVSAAVLVFGRFLIGITSRRFELAADWNACHSLKIEFSVKYPSEILLSALLSVMALQGSRHPKIAYLLMVLGYSHPSIPVRVRRVAATLDDLASNGTIRT
jgi:Zn-dependent protease with chaperone function